MQFSFIFLVITIIIACTLSSVHVQYQSGKFLGKYPIPNKTLSPINIISEKAHEVDLQPLSLHYNPSDKVKVVNNGKLVEVILNQNSTTTKVTGGVFGENEYTFQKIKYLWTDDYENETAGSTIDGKGFPLDNVVVFYNQIYDTFEDALNYRDGVAEVNFYINTCSTPNKIFGNKYAMKLEQIQEVNSTVKTTLGTAISWFAGNGIPPKDNYYAYPGSYKDEADIEYYSATAIHLPHLSEWCLSKEQYAQTFGSFKKVAGQPLMDTESLFPATMPVVHAKGIIIETV